MAEIVGVVASGISIATLVAQVGGCVVKLKGYWGEVQQAPDDISHLLREIESLNVILTHIQDDQARDAEAWAYLDGFTMQQSLRLCQEGADELSTLVTELASKINGKVGFRRRIGSAKMVLKKDDVKRLRRRMKTAIRLLSLAYQCHTSSMIRSQPDLIVARISTMITLPVESKETSPATGTQETNIVQSNSDDVVQQQYSYWMRSPTWIRYLFGQLEFQRQRRQRKKVDVLETRYRFPEWLALKVWEIESCTTPIDWGLKVKTYRVLPYNAPIFETIRQGDVTGVRQMLLSGEAMISDRDHRGHTLLHRAVEKKSQEIVELLLFEGADISSRNVHNFSTITLLYSRLPGEESGNLMDATTAIARTLVNNGMLEAFDAEEDALSRFDGPTETFEFLQQNIYPPYHGLPLKRRMYIADSISKLATDLHHIMRSAVSQGPIDDRMATYVGEKGRTLLHLLLDADLGRVAYNMNAPLRKLVREAIVAGANVHAIDGWNDTPMCKVMRNRRRFFWRRSEHQEACRLMTGSLRAWLSDLLEAGYDLEQYAVEERRLHIAGLVDKNFQVFLYYGPAGVELIGFSHGPRPEDWEFWLSDPTDKFAGDFWRMVESSDPLELSSQSRIAQGNIMPGSWVEGL